MTPVIIDNLRKFGLDFQTKIIAGILSDRHFLERVIDIIDIKAFEIDAHQWILKETIDYFIQYKELPTLSVFKIRIDIITNDALKSSVIENLKSVYMKLTEKDLVFVREQFLEFCKNQKLKSAILESVDHLQSGQYDHIKTLVDNAMKAGAERNLGHNYNVEIDARMSQMCRATVPTNWECIDKLMDGGLGPGELGIFVAPPGAGKCVGPNTEITIQYYETGISTVGNSGNEYVIWFKPFDTIDFGGKLLFGWQIDNILFEIEKLKSELKSDVQRGVKKKISVEVVTMVHLFDVLKIAREENATYSVQFPLYVDTPVGFKQIVTAFHTEKQQSVISSFNDGSIIETSEHHLLKVDGNWKKVKDITAYDLVEIKTGTTTLERKSFGTTQILYDISVEDVHCYYSNGILSHNSWVLAKIGTEAIRQGKNVVHFTLELNENYVGLRYDCCFTHIDFQNIRNNADIVKNKIKDLKGRLIVKYFPLKTVSAQSLKNHIERIQTIEGIKIDLMIVDYADILRASESDKNANSYSTMGNIYEELRGAAGELKLPVWSASQVSRSGSEEDIVTATHIADSFRKIMTADFILSMSRKINDKANNTARFHVIKNRFGPDGITLYAKMNAGNGDIRVYDDKAKESAEIKATMQDEENDTKSQLKKKWNSFRSDDIGTDLNG